MSGRSFRSLFMVASCAGAALGCYLVSLRVASERAALEDVETQIVLAQRDVRVLQTEIGTRGRLAQLERWNAKVLALSAPSADQFLQRQLRARPAGPARSARSISRRRWCLPRRPQPLNAKPPIGEIETATIPARPQPLTPGALLHQASLKTETREVPAKPVAQCPWRPAASPRISRLRRRSRPNIVAG